MNATPSSWRDIFQGTRRAAAVVSLALTLGGCKIAFVATTEVGRDGRVTRTSRYVADEDARTQLEQFYDLPPGGVWKQQRPTFALAATTAQLQGQEYLVTQHVRPGGAVSPDYVRRGEVPGHVASNHVDVRVRPGRVFSTLTYEARYEDAAQFDTAQRMSRHALAAWVEHFAASVEQALGERVGAAQLREALAAYYDPWFAAAIDGARTEGPEFLQSARFQSEVLPAFGKEAVTEGLVAELIARGLAPDEVWRAAIGQAYDRLDADPPSLDADVRERILGVHTFGADVKILERVRLPGRLVSHNATRRDGRELVWEMTPIEFLWAPVTLRAESRAVRWERIGPALAALVALLGMALAAARRRRGRRPAADRGA
jgi:hypothetical protein